MSLSKSSVTITHVTTATAIISIDGINFITDPVFCPAGSEYVASSKTEELSPIDAVLLSHADHVDNLDPLGRQLLDARQVFTTVDGEKKLKPRPAVVDFRITATTCKHLPGGEVTGFVLESDSFGVDSATGLPNVVYFSGVTVWIDELAEIKKKWHVVIAVLNLGNAPFPYPHGMLQITFDGKQAAHYMRMTGADIMVPIHFESWEHSTEHRAELKEVFDKKRVSDQVVWLTPGVAKQIV